MAMAMEGQHSTSHVEFGEFGRRATKHINHPKVVKEAKVVKDEAKDDV